MGNRADTTRPPGLCVAGHTPAAAAEGTSCCQATLISVSSTSAFRDCCVLRPPTPFPLPGGGQTKTFTKEVFVTFLGLVLYQAQYYHSNGAPSGYDAPGCDPTPL